MIPARRACRAITATAYLLYLSLFFVCVPLWTDGPVERDGVHRMPDEHVLEPPRRDRMPAVPR